MDEEEEVREMDGMCAASRYVLCRGWTANHDGFSLYMANGCKECNNSDSQIMLPSKDLEIN